MMYRTAIQGTEVPVIDSELKASIIYSGILLENKIMGRRG